MPEAEDDLESDVDEVIRNCGGNPRAAIRALIIASSYLSAEVDRLAAALSVGYTRGRWRQEPKVGGDAVLPHERHRSGWSKWGRSLEAEQRPGSARLT